jgi:hypothetical protein
MSFGRVVVVASGLVICAAAVHAQQGGPIDPIRELLVEVRGLRAAMERSATMGARVQLLVARIQLQEQRIAELSRRVTSVRAELRQSEQEALQLTGMAKMFEDGSDKMPESERGNMNHQLVMMKSQLATLEKRRLELSQEELFVTQQLSEEQGRWSSINEQLDQLERSLSR